MRKVAVITGTRAEYGILVPLLRAIDRSKGLRLSLVATSMHLSDDFGRTIKDIESDGFHVDSTVEVLPSEDSNAAMATSTARCIEGMAKVFESTCPDIVVVIGDRGEMLSAAVAAMYLNVPVAHIHGGDVSGSIDDMVRHALTKLSHIHFPATRSHARRVLRMGEEPWRVHMVGTLAIDSLKQTKALSRAELEQRFGVDLDRPVVLCVQHPVTTEAELAASQERRTLSALATLGLQTVIVYPNADSGGRRMIDVIEQYRDRPNFHIFRSIPHVEFANLMRVASVLVGNSSAGIIEAPFYKLPVVNIGSRQLGRERAINVIDVRSNRREILAGLERALHDEGFRRSLHHLKNPYGSGDTSGKIVEVLRGTRLDRRLLEKRMTY